MKKSFQIGGAFVGLIVGGGFASGQEIMQFFTNFGLAGILGAIVATICFIILGINILELGYTLKTSSHKKVVHYIGGPVIGNILDFMITVFLFAITIAMIAGTGSTLNQMFGINEKVGALFITVILIITLMYNVEHIIQAIGAFIPYLVIIILCISCYSIFTIEEPINQLEIAAQKHGGSVPNWWMGALLFVSYNIATSLAMLAVIGGTAKSRRIARNGGIVGGILLGMLLILINITIFTKMSSIQDGDLPILKIAISLHPLVGIFMAIILLAMVYSTAVGTFYAFIARFISQNKKMYKPTVVIFAVTGYFLSFIGFTTMISKVYTIMGYLGFLLIFIVIMKYFKKSRLYS